MESRIVFISHSSKDDDIARKMATRLSEMGISCWFDREILDNDALQGSDYARAIVNAIDQAQLFVAIISREASESENVKNEIDLAHKRIGEGMVILPFKIMPDDLQEELRYYFARMNITDATIPPMDVRIEDFCNLVQDAVNQLLDFDSGTVASKQLRMTRIGEEYSVATTEQVKLALEPLSAPRLARELRKAHDDLQAYYQEHDDPFDTYAYFCSYKFLDQPLPAVIEVLFNQGRYSLALGRIYEFVSYFLINDGDKAFVRRARASLHTALEIYERSYNQNPDIADSIAERIIHCQWLLAITYKQEKNFGTAEEILVGLLNYAKEKQEDFGLPYDTTVLYPLRELAIVKGDGDIFDELLEHIDDFADNKKQVFYTYRRAYSYYCSEGDFEKATELRQRTREAYEDARDQLYGIYYYAMRVVDHEYCCAFRFDEEERRLYDELLVQLEENHFVRYLNEVKRNHDHYLKGRRLRGYGESY